MTLTLKFVSLFLVVATVVPSVAHVLELPGKLRLTREQYFAVQPIYYPGFTIAGMAEPVSILVLIALVVMTPVGTVNFWLLIGTTLLAALAHLLYWILTAPVNKVWLRNETISNSAQRFFDAGANIADADWTLLRDRWERSHVLRAIASVVAFGLLAAALLI